MQRKWAEDADSECLPTASLSPWSWNQYACRLVAIRVHHRLCDPQSAPSLCWTLPHLTPRGPAATAEVRLRCQAVQMRLRRVSPNHISAHNEISPSRHGG